MAALWQEGRASSDGSTVTQPCVTVYFQYGNALNTVSFNEAAKLNVLKCDLFTAIASIGFY